MTGLERKKIKKFFSEVIDEKFKALDIDRKFEELKIQNSEIINALIAMAKKPAASEKEKKDSEATPWQPPNQPKEEASNGSTIKPKTKPGPGRPKKEGN